VAPPRKFGSTASPLDFHSVSAVSFIAREVVVRGRGVKEIGDERLRGRRRRETTRSAVSLATSKDGAEVGEE
jgi:hypothetical protein